MTVLDVVAAVVRRILGVFSPSTSEALFFPVFALVVVTGFVLVVRKLVPPAARLAATGLAWLVTVAGAVVLLGEMAVATGYRQRKVRPPSALYNLGDVVASWVTALIEGSRRACAVVGKVADVNAWVLILLSVGWIWLWNDRQCPDVAASCARPVSAWYQQISSG